MLLFSELLESLSVFNTLCMDCYHLPGCLATLSILVVKIVLLEYSRTHENAYKFIVCQFGGF